jgi:hypothetical protein
VLSERLLESYDLLFRKKVRRGSPATANGKPCRSIVFAEVTSMSRTLQARPLGAFPVYFEEDEVIAQCVFDTDTVGAFDE